MEKGNKEKDKLDNRTTMCRTTGKQEEGQQEAGQQGV